MKDEREKEEKGKHSRPLLPLALIQLCLGATNCRTAARRWRRGRAPPLRPLHPPSSRSLATFRLFSTLPYQLQMDGSVAASNTAPPPQPPSPTTAVLLLLLLRHLASVPLQHPADFVTPRWEARTEDKREEASVSRRMRRRRSEEGMDIQVILSRILVLSFGRCFAFTNTFKVKLSHTLPKDFLSRCLFPLPQCRGGKKRKKMWLR